MESSAHSHVLKHNLLNCEPVHLNVFVVYHAFLGAFLKSKIVINDLPHQCCAPLTTRALVMRSPCTLPKYMLLDLRGDDVIRTMSFAAPP